MTPFQSSTGSADGTTRSSKVSSAGRNLKRVLVHEADVLRGRVVMMRLPEQILHFGFEPAIAFGCSAESREDSGPGPTRLRDSKQANAYWTRSGQRATGRAM